MKPDFRALTAIAVAAFTLSLASASFAQEPPAGGGQSPVREACHSDMQKLCAGIQPGDALRQCMREHQAELSDGCKSAIMTARANHHGGSTPPPTSQPGSPQ